MTKYRLLRVIAPNFVAGVVFKKMPMGYWAPVRASPILGWTLAHQDHCGIAMFLKGPAKRRGWTFEWL